MTEARKHLPEIIDRACRHETPTIITRRGRSEAVLLGIEEYHRLCEAAERSEDEWLNRLADQAESEGTEGAVPMEQMAALLRSTN
ncbi:type II toxin-antitoxin system Phd/YefM family antitoxin [Streptomyces arboris]|uniref:Antitoxin n=1 Tax=Streptomyces arboris TaxID=2600619 RepID=A0A5N5EDU1_9ACTN|nr:type II toxin-antitoxin system Phd/YefM family antitoxin [Streptomyces arboris]KAB2588856.1 type II toxin-antitoxin system Phd/YefM family antitoxin [Streptomyces arboris]